MDRLAAQGMRFTQAYADAQCSPTRAAFLSGQYGARTGVFKVLNEKEPSFAPMRSAAAKEALGPETGTLATTLREEDYKSLLPLLTQTGTLERPALFWHMPPTPRTAAARPVR